MAISKTKRRNRIRKGIRKRISGDAERPRLAVFRSNREIYAQLINDETAETLLFASSREKDFTATGTKAEIAQAVGERLAEKALEAGIEKAAFDRSGYLYHGRVKALADGARKGGLNF
ncbi:MAG TPA: 50S ribosomal protein L18 [Flavobacteriaceae bacterium]|nr:50S ribosomal protein L18 [Flavobacteriaceae bacterium]